MDEEKQICITTDNGSNFICACKLAAFGCNLHFSIANHIVLLLYCILGIMEV